MPLDLDALADLIADTVKAETEPLKRRIAELEAREPVPGPTGERGEKGEPGEPGRDGADADIEAIAARVLPEIERAVAENMPEPIPGPAGEKGEPGEKGEKGEPGESPDKEAIVAEFRSIAFSMFDDEEFAARFVGEKGDPGERGEKGAPGKDADPDAIVAKVLEQIPPPERGEKGDSGPQGERGEKGEPGEQGADGINMAGGFVDQRGHLMLTRSNGDIQDAGLVKGADGHDGHDGAPGRDGKDGLGFDDLSVTHDGHRTFTLAFARGAERKAFDFSLPVVLDCGVFREGETYRAGDGVTWGGSFWIAQAETATKPGEGTEDWRLAVKRGRDGKVPDIDAIVERALPKMTQKLAPVIRRAIDDAMKNG